MRRRLQQILTISLLTAPMLLAEDLDEGKIGTFKDLGTGKRFALLIGVSEYEFSTEFVNPMRCETPFSWRIHVGTEGASSNAWPCPGPARSD